ncbi:MAG: prepilin peptidase [archaeon]|nr:prepilin peptidase [archaeon]
MIEFIFLFGIGFAWILYAAVSDIRTREIPNWLNFSLILFALSFRFFYSLFNLGDFSFFYQGLIGLLIFFILGKILYYGRMFAGGDEKLMIALGAVLPVFSNFSDNLRVFLIFFLLFFFVGAVYGIFGSLFISVKNKGLFKKGFKKLFRENKRFVALSIVLGITSLIMGFFLFPFFYLGLFLFIFPYFYLFIKSVDEFCMVKEVPISTVTPGDWLYRDVKVGNKTVRATWDGLSEEDIKLLRKKRKIKIRFGLVFAPVFLISFALLGLFLKYDLIDKILYGLF